MDTLEVLHDKYSDFSKNERTLVSEWNLTVPEISDVRNAYLRKGIHFRTTPGSVWYSEIGVRELSKYVSPKEIPLNDGPALPNLARCVPRDWPLSDTILAVDRIWANPRLIRCVDVSGVLYNIHVPSNRTFRRGMRVNLETQVRRAPASDTSAERLVFMDKVPRFNGRW